MADPTDYGPIACETFIEPKDGLYGAYCDRCGYSRELHELNRLNEPSPE